MHVVLADALFVWAFARGSESESEKTIKLTNSLKAWDEELQKSEGLYYHYTCLEISKLIAKSGFKVSAIGMQGKGLYVATQSPVDPSFEHQWPAEEWKEQMLRANYADAWQDPARQSLINVVIVLQINRDWLKPVESRPGALLLSETFYRNHKGFIAKDLIKSIIVLYTGSNNQTGDQHLSNLADSEALLSAMIRVKSASQSIN